MSTPLTENQIDQLIAAYVDRTITEDGLKLLSGWLGQSSSNLDRVAQLAMTDFCLSDVCKDHQPKYLLELLGELERASGPAQIVVLDDKQRPWAQQQSSKASILAAFCNPWLYGGMAAVLALSLALVVALNRGGDATDPIVVAPIPGETAGDHETTMAVITAQSEARWIDSSRAVGDALYANHRLLLVDGAAEITTRHGARALLEAPCEITIVGENEVRLTRGKLVGKCPTQQSKGFVVDTPDARVVDVGTEFGVSVSAQGVVDVRVFTGFVDVATGTDRDQKQFLATGDLARVASGQLERVTYDAAFDFQRELLARKAVPQLTGQVRWLSSSPPSIYEHELVDASSAYLFLEKEDAVVPVGTVLNATGPSPPIQTLDRVIVESEMKADVYKLHFDPVTLDRASKTVSGEGRVQGRIMFDRPIVGVIVNYLRLKSTQPLFANPDVKYGYKPTRGLEDGEAHIGPDGRTLIFDFSAGSNDLDQMRILVAP